MKRLIAWMLLLVMAAALAGCRESEEIRDPVSFYYRRAAIEYGGEDGVVAPEKREAYGLREDLLALLQLYIRGPETEGLVNVFPHSAEVLAVSQEETVVTVHMSRSFSQLGGIRLSVACTCLAKTVMELTGAETVRISADNATLAGARYLEFDKDTVLLEDTGAVHTEPTTGN